MNMLLPFFMAGGMLIGVPLVLHFLRRKPRVDVLFPTLRFLGPTAVRESKMHRLRRWLTLLLRCLIILLICAAFSRPFWNASREGEGKALVIAVDNSYSMQAGGRWENLRTWALDQMKTMGGADQAGLLLMNPTPRWLVPMTRNIDQVKTTLTTLPPGFETTHYNGALRLSGDALLHSGAKEMALAWMGDEQQLGWQGVNFSEPLPAGIAVSFPPVPEVPKRQAAITKAQWSDQGSGSAINLSIAQFLPDHDTRTVTVTVDGKPVATQSVALETGKENSVLIPLKDLDADKVRSARVELDADDLPADDRFYITHSPGDRLRVFVTPFEGGADGFDFLSEAVNSTKTTLAPLRTEKLPDGEWPVHSIVLVRGVKPFVAPMSDRLEHFLKSGGTAWLFLNGAPEQEAWLKAQGLTTKPVAAASEDEPLHLRNWDTLHPALKPLAESLSGLLGVEFYKGISVQGVDASALATWDDGSAAVAEVTHDWRHFLLSGFDLDRDTTNWPMQASFVPFVHSAAMWLAQEQPAGTDWRVGGAITLPGEGTWESVDAPRVLASTKISGSVRPEAPGLYRFFDGKIERFYAVNLRTEESDVTPWPTPTDFTRLVSHGAGAAEAEKFAVALSKEDSESQQRLWWWLIAIAFILLFAELRLANRTST